MAEKNSSDLSILWINQNFVSPRQPGNSRPLHIITAFLGRGWKTDIITSRTGYMGGDRNDPLDIEKENGLLRIHRLNISEDRSSSSRVGRTYLEFCSRSFFYNLRIRGIDLIYTSSPPLPHIVVSIFISLLRNTPLVFEIRDLWPWVLRDLRFPFSKMTYFFLEWIESLCYIFADHLIPVVPSYAEYLKRVGVPREKISTVPTGADPVLADIPREIGVEWRKRMGFEDDFLVIYTGSFNEMYQIDVLVEAAESMAGEYNDIKWLLAGNGRKLPLIKEAASRNGNIIYLGNLPKDELIPLYSAADVGVVATLPVPTIKTNLTGKLFDYMGSGLVVVSLLPGLTEGVINRSGCGYVAGRSDAESLKDLIIRAYRLGNDKREEMGLKGQQWILKNINAVDMGQKVAEIVAGNSERMSRISRTIRFFRALVQSFSHTLSGKSGSVIREIFVDDSETTLNRALEDWLNENEAVPSREETQNPHSVPELLTKIKREYS